MNYLYKVGQRVRIVGNSTIHHYAPLGQVGKIKSFASWGNREPYREAYVVSCETTNGRPTQVIIEHDLRSVGARVV